MCAYATPQSVLELHHHSDRHLRLAAAKVREPDTASSAPAGYLRRRQVVGSRCCARTARVILGKAIISAGWSGPAAPGKIRNVGVAISNLRPPRDVLSGHVLKVDR